MIILTLIVRNVAVESLIKTIHALGRWDGAGSSGIDRSYS